MNSKCRHRDRLRPGVKFDRSSIGRQITAPIYDLYRQIGYAGRRRGFRGNRHGEFRMKAYIRSERSWMRGGWLVVIECDKADVKTCLAVFPLPDL
jgi:hypothetical protein